MHLQYHSLPYFHLSTRWYGYSSSPWSPMQGSCLNSHDVLYGSGGDEVCWCKRFRGMNWYHSGSDFMDEEKIPRLRLEYKTEIQSNEQDELMTAEVFTVWWKCHMQENLWTITNTGVQVQYRWYEGSISITVNGVLFPVTISAWSITFLACVPEFQVLH